MKKIMFNDRYGLTSAVLQGTKTVTRRVIPQKAFGRFEIIDNRPISWDVNGNGIEINPPYRVGEIVAVSQSYKNAGYDEDKVLFRSIPELNGYLQQNAPTLKGWNNKMFVCANLMPHQIRILDIRAERLQDVTEEDCRKEGIEYEPIKLSNGYELDLHPRNKFAALIDKISGYGTWKRNPYVWRIEFELVK